MSLLQKLWLIWFFEKRYVSKSKLLVKFLAHMAALASLFVFCAQLLILFLGSLVWLSYLLLIRHGLAPEQAALILCAGILALLACAVLTLRHAFSEVEVRMKYELYKKTSLGNAATRIVQSFVNGMTHASYSSAR